MTPILIAIAVVHLCGLLVIIVATMRAPSGYEDESGFHSEPSRKR